jgi:hypothetical protein
MSYSIQEAIEEQNAAIDQALQSRDSEALYQLADIVKEQGEDELAEELTAAARRIDREDWSYDVSVNN